jgi:AbrB family looped-hinge helix DNA binding protein
MPPIKKVGTNRRYAKAAKKSGATAERPIMAEPSRVGKRGTVVIPAALRRRFGIEEGTFVVAEPREGGVLIRPAVILPLEVYTPERKAQFLLSNAVDAADYAGAVAAVRAMGLDPSAIPHYKPPGA